MNERLKISSAQKQKLKKYAVFALMAIICVGCIWLIFKPSDADKIKLQEGIGFNADIPDPGKDEIIGDKKDAYEKEQMQNKQKDRMQSLQGYISMLENESSAKTEPVVLDYSEPEATTPEEAKEPIGSSVSAYKDINRTLGTFYEQPKIDPEKEEMKKRLEELEAKMNEKDSKQSAMDEQLELMEKSYQMAAKYMPQVQQDNGNQSLSKRIANGTVKNSSNNNKTKITPIRQIRNQTVSALAQSIGGDEYYQMYDQPRNISFNTVGGTVGVSEKNTIAAIVHDDQTVVDGQTTRLRLTEPLMAGTTLIPENTIVTGLAKVQGERMEIQISSIEYEGTIIPVEMMVYDSDGQRGIYIPGSLEMNAAKEIIANMGSSVGTSFTMTESTGAQLTSDLTKGAIQGLSAYMQKKIRQVKITLKSGYRVMLMPK
ncbi:conjugative transposon TraM protein [Dysgonomonas sp. PFB1-18]|uniref:conjugative transposon protein TraM n=1 Tax=unclassified Dysgonomonas TaxID=2630389 RepID=UPI002476E05D|nr:MULTISPECIES: conjugative transposon protein TraM [unclassified Dysgonomonas]MDH6308846.1 conjugative transposon TraM protein [Dysgonomonas sp. PF1-14]MDH6338458.1 conjugative transposon TraM protein [Dysgonomonas sp. PF1-16]MDH6380095.1 conjugative transposon TraM protein [Dysgonomonas sp. PFB1-18]MDH6397286.1 conjugative transposon TraM protein [Dysgonomonas sp. PF1-23]